MGEDRDRPIGVDYELREHGQGDDERRPAVDRDRYLSTKEAADLLGVNRATVINWARQGKFGGIQYGVRGIYRFDRQELLDFISRSRIPFPDGGESVRGDDAGVGG